MTVRVGSKAAGRYGTEAVGEILRFDPQAGNREKEAGNDTGCLNLTAHHL